MRSSKDDILYSHWMKDVEEAFVVLRLLPSTVKNFFNSFRH